MKADRKQIFTRKIVSSIFLFFLFASTLSIYLFISVFGQSSKYIDIPHVVEIEKIYGITIKTDEYWHQESQMVLIEPHLMNIEKTLSLLGSDFTKELVKVYNSSSVTKFNNAYINVKNDRLYIDLRHVESAASAYFDTDGKIVYSGSDANPVTVYLSLHEFGHVLFFAVRGANDYPQSFSEETHDGTESACTRSLHPERFANSYAETSPDEDYAECFQYAVLNGASNPLKHGADTPIYRKTLAVYEDLLKVVDADTLVAQRVAGYLGLN